MENRRHPRFYDHRLVGVVQQTRDLSVATRAGVPRSTAAGWLKQGPRAVAVVLVHAQRSVEAGTKPPTLMVDDGVENLNAQVDALVERGVLQRVLAQSEVQFSNSMIEAWWRQLKHNWLFLNELESLSKLTSLVAFYVAEHNSTIPHAAFNGQTPDEMYFGTGAAVPDQLAHRRAAARQARMEANRARRCATCA